VYVCVASIVGVVAIVGCSGTLVAGTPGMQAVSTTINMPANKIILKFCFSWINVFIPFIWISSASLTTVIIEMFQLQRIQQRFQQ
jgi:hypothetical protein